MGIALLLFIGDLGVPNGIAYGGVYTIAILTTLWSPQRRVTIITAAVTSTLTVVGAFLGGESDAASASLVAMNRSFAIAAAWAIAFIIVHHKKTTRALQLERQHEATILDNIQTAFVEMDASGRISSWNRHAEVIFGWSRAEAVGRILAETIVPEASREAHRRGLERYLASGEAKLLDKRIELEAIRRDGSIFPVELLLGVRSGASDADCFYGFVQDITERKRTERELRKSHRIMADLAGRLISSHEDERRRLARHLHDDFSQRVAILTMELAQAEQAVPEEVQKLLQVVQQQAEDLSRELHELSHRLHPAVLEQLGVVAGIRNECDRFQELEDIEVSFHSDVTVRVPADIALALYRVVQEGLRNVAKHAQARHATVWLAGKEGLVQVSVTDDGVGFETGSGDDRVHLGLLSMNERARAVRGRFQITSEPGQGTCVEVEVPLPVSAAPLD